MKQSMKQGVMIIIVLSLIISLVYSPAVFAEDIIPQEYTSEKESVTQPEEMTTEDNEALLEETDTEEDEAQLSEAEQVDDEQIGTEEESTEAYEEESDVDESFEEETTEAEEEATTEAPEEVTTELPPEEEVITDITTDGGASSEYIVVTEDQNSFAEVQEEAEDKDLLADEQKDILLENNVVMMDLSENEAAQLESFPGVVSVEENVQMEASEEVPVDEEAVDDAESNEELPFSRWNLDAIQLPSNVPSKGTGVKVAVLDSGINISDDLPLEGSVDLTASGESEENSPIFVDESGHGSGIAGIIASSNESERIRGIADDCSLYSIKVLDENNQAPLSRVLEGIYWCCENGMDVINMSFGMTGYSSALEAAITTASDNDIIMVAAAGNRGSDATGTDYPAAFSNVIAVGASNSNGEKTDFTSIGEGIDILAPGEKVWTDGVLGGMVTVDGTSIATAHVTGAVALLLSNHTNIDLDYIRNLLVTTSIKAVNSQEGILNISSAVEQLSTFIPEEGEVEPRSDVPVQRFDTTDIVSGCWSPEIHRQTALQIVSNKYTQVMARMAKYMDTYFKVSEGYGAFHGQHNYVANLHFLYYAARYAKLSSCPYDLTNNSDITSFVNGLNLAHDYDEPVDVNDYVQMRTAIKNVLNGTTKVNGSTQTLLSAAKKQSGLTGNTLASCVIMGMAVHLLGDTFAHRTMVPRTAGSVNSLFSDYSTVNNRFYTGHFRDWQDFYNRQQDWVLETRDINMYKASGTDTKKYYEDNSESGGFYVSRYTYTKKTINSMLNLFSVNGGSGSAYNPTTIFDQSGYSLYLNNLNAYAHHAGYTDFSCYYSTNRFRVDMVDGILHPNEQDCLYYDRYVYGEGYVSAE